MRTGLGPEATLAALHRVEDAFGRVRSEPNAPRAIDLDLLDYNRTIKSNYNNSLIVLPHPRLEQRAFVLLPLAALAPDWRHPATGATVQALIAGLPTDQRIAPVDP